MRAELYAYVSSQRDLKKFIRMNPIWYRKLSRNPYAIYELEEQANEFYGRTFPQRLEKLQNSLQLAAMLMQMFPMTNQS